MLNFNLIFLVVPSVYYTSLCFSDLECCHFSWFINDSHWKLSISLKCKRASFSCDFPSFFIGISVSSIRLHLTASEGGGLTSPITYTF